MRNFWLEKVNIATGCLEWLRILYYVLIKLAEIIDTDILELIPTEEKLTYNNIHNVHKGDGVVYKKKNNEKIVELYKKVLVAKDNQIVSFNQVIQSKDEQLEFYEEKTGSKNGK